jgi:hypothetical protein
MQNKKEMTSAAWDVGALHFSTRIKITASALFPLTMWEGRHHEETAPSSNNN